MNQSAKYKLIGFVMMFASSSLMGGIGAFTRFIDAPGDFVSFWRNFAGFICLTIIFCFISGSWRKVKETRFSGTMLASGVFLGLLSGLYCLSTQYTTLANASFLIYTGPIYSTILAAIFLKEKLSIKSVICIIAVVVGMLFIVGIITPEGLTLSLDPSYAFGNAIAFASGIAYGLYLFFSRYREDCDSNVRSWWNFLFGSLSILVLLVWHHFFLASGIAYGLYLFFSRYREDCDSNVRSWWNFLFGSLSILVLLVWHHFFLQPLSYPEKINGVTQFDATGQIITHPWNLFTMDGSSWAWLIAAALITGFGAFYLLTHNGVTQFDATGQIITHPWNLFTMDGSSWAWLIAAALITGFGAFYLLTHATKRLKAGELAAISYQETIMASLLGLFLFGETMTAFQVIGGALIIAGGVSQVVFSTKSAGAKGEKIEKEAEIRENLATRIEEESEKEGLK